MQIESQKEDSYAGLPKFDSRTLWETHIPQTNKEIKQVQIDKVGLWLGQQESKSHQDTNLNA